MRFAVLRALLTLAACIEVAACSGDTGSSSMSPELATLAYVQTECRNSDSGWWGSQSLRVQADGIESVVAEFPRFGRFAPAFCMEQALVRYGDAFMSGGVLQRLGVSPNGDTVVFEVTDDLGYYGRPDVPEEQEGMFLVRADGSGSRRIGPASSDPAWRIDNFGNYAMLPVIRFSPDGTQITFTDLGPGPDGEIAPQVFVVDLATGARRQLTELPEIDPLLSFHPALSQPAFADDETISFLTGEKSEGFIVSTVKADGSGEVTRQPPPVAIPGATVVSSFRITDTATSIFTMSFPGFGLPPFLDLPPFELVASTTGNTVQLTNFGRIDTGAESSTLAHPVIGDRVYFTASTNVLGGNPYEACQLFSVDLTGADLRQVATLDPRQFSSSDHPRIGCLNDYPPGCWGAVFGHDPRGTILVQSSCDPLGTNPDGGQLFAVETDGSNLRQLTAAAGVFTDADGYVGVELAGPQASPEVF